MCRSRTVCGAEAMQRFNRTWQNNAGVYRFGSDIFEEWFVDYFEAPIATGPPRPADLIAGGQVRIATGSVGVQPLENCGQITGCHAPPKEIQS